MIRINNARRVSIIIDPVSRTRRRYMSFSQLCHRCPVFAVRCSAQLAYVAATPEKAPDAALQPLQHRLDQHRRMVLVSRLVRLQPGEDIGVFLTEIDLDQESPVPLPIGLSKPLAGPLTCLFFNLPPLKSTKPLC